MLNFIPDSHIHPPGWGIRPVLFSWQGFNVPSYGFFIALGLIAGAFVYWYFGRKQKHDGPSALYVAIAAIAGGILGAKILALAVNYRFIAAHFSDINAFLYGRTLVGGLIGGLISVLLVKRKLRITRRMGNAFAPAVALGVAIGRIGCFLTGCCYGKATNLPWGVNFGDGVMRHPTQIYEAIFLLGLFAYFGRQAGKDGIKPGRLFTEFLGAYFVFRLFLEFIKEEQPVLLGLTIFQIISIIVIIYLITAKEKIMNTRAK